MPGDDLALDEAVVRFMDPNAERERPSNELCLNVLLMSDCPCPGVVLNDWAAGHAGDRMSFSLSLRLTLHTGSRLKGDAVMAYVGDPSHKSVLRSIYR